MITNPNACIQEFATGKTGSKSLVITNWGGAGGKSGTSAKGQFNPADLSTKKFNLQMISGNNASGTHLGGVSDHIKVGQTFKGATASIRQIRSRGKNDLLLDLSCDHPAVDA